MTANSAIRENSYDCGNDEKGQNYSCSSRKRKMMVGGGGLAGSLETVNFDGDCGMKMSSPRHGMDLLAMATSLEYSTPSAMHDNEVCAEARVRTCSNSSGSAGSSGCLGALSSSEIEMVDFGAIRRDSFEDYNGNDHLNDSKTLNDNSNDNSNGSSNSNGNSNYHQSNEEKVYDSTKRQMIEPLMMESSVIEPSLMEHQTTEQQRHFLNRVSNLPIVNTTLDSLSKYYQATKASSNIVKYSAETVETIVPSICKPVFYSLEPSLNRLDSFACRQLDRLEESIMRKRATHNPNHINDYEGERTAATTTATATPLNSSSMPNASFLNNNNPEKPVDFVGLQSCLNFLLSAQNRIDLLIGQLRSGLVAAQVSIESSIGSWSINRSIDAGVSGSAAAVNRIHQLTMNMKREVVEILRRVVDIIGFSLNSLPLALQTMVKKFVLTLPERWTTITASPFTSSSPSSPSFAANANGSTQSVFLTQAHQVMVLANESVIMLQSIGAVVSQYVSARVVNDEPSTVLQSPSQGNKMGLESIIN